MLSLEVSRFWPCCPFPHGWRHPCPVLAVGREHPIKAGQMDTWFGYVEVRNQLRVGGFDTVTGKLSH